MCRISVTFVLGVAMIHLIAGSTVEAMDDLTLKVDRI